MLKIKVLSTSFFKQKNLMKFRCFAATATNKKKNGIMGKKYEQSDFRT